MSSGIINYIRTYENEVYLRCLSTDYVDMEKGEGNKVRVFDKELWNNIDQEIRVQIERDYIKFISGTFED